MNEEEKITNQGFDTEFANAVDLIAQVRRGVLLRARSHLQMTTMYM